APSVCPRARAPRRGHGLAGGAGSPPGIPGGTGQGRRALWLRTSFVTLLLSRPTGLNYRSGGTPMASRDPLIEHMLRRVGFGAAPGEAEQHADLGYATALDRLINYESIYDGVDELIGQPGYV